MKVYSALVAVLFLLLVGCAQPTPTPTPTATLPPTPTPTPTVTPTPTATTSEQNKQSLLTGIAAGQPLYYKVLKYQKDPLGPGGSGSYPSTTISENWFVAGDDGQISDAVATLRTQAGVLLGYSKLINGALVYTDIQTGEEFVLNHDFSGTLSSIVDSFWALPQSLQNRGVAVKEQGTLSERASLIYEKQQSNGRLRRTELVENAQMLYKESIYDGASAVQSALRWENALVEYKLLPAGTALPTVP